MKYAMPHFRRPLLVITMLVLWPWMTGFVLLSSKKATLPVTPDQPQLTFVWDGKAPRIDEKEKFRDGRYAGLDDIAFMQQLLVEALGIWNSVPGSYITLAVTQGNAKLDSEDRQFSIITEKSNNLSSAAFAKPEIPDDDPETIVDCDISIADNKTSAKDLAFTIAHEIGHCLGLGHNHTNYNAMMGYSRGSRQLRLGADDIAGLIYLYPDPDYVDGEPRELACGTIGGDREASLTWLLALIFLPLAFAMGLARHHAPNPRLLFARTRATTWGNRRV